MAFFFKEPPDADVQVISIVDEALGLKEMPPGVARLDHAKYLVGKGKSRPKSVPVDWRRVGFAFFLLIVLFVGANYVKNEQASTTLLHCFEILFTAFIGLFGIEAATKA